MRVSAALSGNDSGIAFIGLSSMDRNNIRVRSSPLHFVESKTNLCHKECALSITLLETVHYFNPGMLSSVKSLVIWCCSSFRVLTRFAQMGEFLPPASISNMF
jgi:hypothetical protein